MYLSENLNSQNLFKSVKHKPHIQCYNLMLCNETYPYFLTFKLLKLSLILFSFYWILENCQSVEIAYRLFMLTLRIKM